MANNRGGLSKREYAAKIAGKPMPYALKATKSTPVMSTSKARKSASSSVSKESKALQAAQKEYLKSLEPSKEETEATASLGEINKAAEMEAARIRDPRQNTVALPFMERQADALGTQTEQKVIPLKYQIAALQSQREAKSNIASSKYKFAGEAYNRKVASIKENDPLEDEYKTLRNENLRATISKKGRSGSDKSEKEEKDYVKALADSQKKVLIGTSNREAEMSYLNTRFKKNLNQQDIVRDGYSVLKGSKTKKGSGK